MALSAELSSPVFLSEFSFRRYTVEAIGHVPLHKKTLVTVLRARGQLVNGNEAPFYERALLGGETNLRGFGEGRFTDRTSMVFSIEQRIRLFSFVMRKTHCEVEVAPFFDWGKVSSVSGAFSMRDYQFVPGCGFRILVPDSEFVAKGDVAYSRDGLAIVLSINYPF